MKNITELRDNVLRFVQQRQTDVVGEYNYSLTGSANLYSSCYALMTLHYLDKAPVDREKCIMWANYLNQWQDEETGYFIGPELNAQDFEGKKHNLEHLKLHLTTTILPCLEILGHKPRWKLNFAEKFLNKESLANWLHERDWTDAWLEGNNLLFVIQILIYCRDVEKRLEANDRIDEFFSWLDNAIDPATGLWGTNGYCSEFVAMCGGYHQLLAYYYENRSVKYPERLVDTTLKLQHADGGFHPNGGGGACEDVDAVDILVNLYKLSDYRRADIRYALRKAYKSIIEKQMPDGGFVYRLNEPFSHMGMVATHTPPNNSNMFATWFRVHTLALISEVLTDTELRKFEWRFNNSLSMGWHRVWDRNIHRVTLYDKMNEIKIDRIYKLIVKNSSWYFSKLQNLIRG